MFLRSRSSELVRDTHTGLSSLVWLDSRFFFCSGYRLLVDYFPWHLSTDCKTGAPAFREVIPRCLDSHCLCAGGAQHPGVADPWNSHWGSRAGWPGCPTGTTAVARCGLKGAAWFDCLGVFSNIWENFSWLLLRLDQTRSQILWTLRGQMDERQEAVFLKGSPATWTSETYFMTWPLSLWPQILSMASPRSPASFHTSLPPFSPHHPVLLFPRDLWIYYLFHLCS